MRKFTVIAFVFFPLKLWKNTNWWFFYGFIRVQ